MKRVVLALMGAVTLCFLNTPLRAQGPLDMITDAEDRAMLPEMARVMKDKDRRSGGV